MVQTVTKWKVTVTFSQPQTLPDRTVELWISENHIGNVLRTVASLQFSETGLDTLVTTVMVTRV